MIPDIAKLGWKVRDKISGFEGIAEARCEYLYGVTRFQVTATVTNGDGQIVSEWFEVDRLTVVDAFVGEALA